MRFFNNRILKYDYVWIFIYGIIACHKLSLGTGLSTYIFSLDTGCMNSTLRANNDMLPSGLLRRAPYFKSPFIGQPIFANWHRI